MDQFKGIPGTSVDGIATISGATMTSTAVKNGVNAAVAYVAALAGGAQ